MKANPVIIRLDNVTMRYAVPKRYREFLLRPLGKSVGFVALGKVNLQVQRGDCVALLGPNGAGKSTLLKLIGGLLYPTQGSVTVMGHDTRGDNAQARRSVGFVLNEDRSFFWRLSGVQNLEFFGALDNLYGRGLQTRIGELIEVVGLAEARHTRVSNYSTGMRQRLAIARGLLADPEILLLDEPTKSLDPLAALRMRQLIHTQIRALGPKTLVIATHQIPEAQELCNKVCLLRAGSLMAVRSLEELAVEGVDLHEFYLRVMGWREREGADYQELAVPCQTVETT